MSSTYSDILWYDEIRGMEEFGEWGIKKKRVTGVSRTFGPSFSGNNIITDRTTSVTLFHGHIMKNDITM